MIYKNVIKPLLFSLDPEKAHYLTIDSLHLFNYAPLIAKKLRQKTLGNPQILKQKLWDIDFESPIGLAAGLDKNGEALSAWGALGFGFAEIGSVTPKGQIGNPKPRLFRLPEDEAIINRMGFNNYGANFLKIQLKNNKKNHLCPIAVNIGKNKNTPNEKASEDYCQCVEKLWDFSDLWVVNVSSPNTPSLRDLQEYSELRSLIKNIVDKNQEIQKTKESKKPVLVKLAPDLDFNNFEASIEAILQAKANGIIISNTTLSRENLMNTNKKEMGGASGKPLKNKSNELIELAFKQIKNEIPIIGVGGIFNAKDAYEKILLGANLVEIYTGLIYQGPMMPALINKELQNLLKQDGFNNIQEAVGFKNK